MKVGLGLIFLAAVLIAFAEFAIWNECRVSPSAYCARVLR